MVALLVSGAGAPAQPEHVWSAAVAQVHNPGTPIDRQDLVDHALTEESEEVLELVEAEAEPDPEREAPVWGLLAKHRAYDLQLTPHPKTLQRFEWPPIQVLKTRLELAFAARGPPRC